MPDDMISCTLIHVVDDPYFEAAVETFSVTVDYFDSLVSFSTSTASISIHDDDSKSTHIIKYNNCLLHFTDVEIGFFFSSNNINIREEGNAADTKLIVTQTGQVDIPVSVALIPINGTATGTFSVLLTVIMTHFERVVIIVFMS